jgi:hypothetical protein
MIIIENVENPDELTCKMVKERRMPVILDHRGKPLANPGRYSIFNLATLLGKDPKTEALIRMDDFFATADHPFELKFVIPKDNGMLLEFAENVEGEDYSLRPQMPNGSFLKYSDFRETCMLKNAMQVLKHFNHVALVNECAKRTNEEWLLLQDEEGKIFTMLDVYTIQRAWLLV